MCFIRTLHTEQFNHAPAQMFMQTGFERFGRPSLGAWTNYGIGSPIRTFPDLWSWSLDHIPVPETVFSAVVFCLHIRGLNFAEKEIPFSFNPKGVDASARRKVISAVNQLNEMQLDGVGIPRSLPGSASMKWPTVCRQVYPELKDISKESQTTLDAYGAKVGGAGFANNCAFAAPHGRAGRSLCSII